MAWHHPDVLLRWLRERSREKLLETPFPDPWRKVLAACVGPWARWDAAQRKRLEDLVQVFIAEKQFEGLGGLELDDEIRVTIAGQACLLIWGMDDHELYRRVETILVYPSAVASRRSGGFLFPRRSDEELTPILGEAHLRGPVILAWDATLRGAKDPRDGVNLVFHEFAHKLDMLDGHADGTPPLESRAETRRWAEVCEREFLRLRADVEADRRTLLDPYGAVNEAEFFAVATELFFERPDAMQHEAPELFTVLRDFYRQTPAVAPL